MRSVNLMRDQINEIFQDVRSHFIWRPDPEWEIQYKDGTLKIKDHWDLMEPDENGTLRGDCEDFALYCSKMCKEQLGISKKNRTLTFCRTETGEGHMVVEILGYILDNRQRTLTTIQKLKSSGYRDFAQPVGPVNGKWEWL